MDFLSLSEGIVGGLVVGAGLTYGFRGWINRFVEKEKGKVLVDVKDAHSILSASLAKTEADIRKAIDEVRIKLAKWL